MAVSPPVGDFGWKAPDFRLPATDGRSLSLADAGGPKGTLIMFVCNHRPCVLAVLDRIQRDAVELQAMGIGVAAICPNDATTHPDDSFANMARMAQERGCTFPDLHDEDQSVARAYGAACTPDFFGFNAAGELQYRGRLDASGRNPAPPDARRDLFEVMTRVTETGRGPRDQVTSMGCSMKWQAA
jgi:peroxiredoxin